LRWKFPKEMLQNFSATLRSTLLVSCTSLSAYICYRICVDEFLVFLIVIKVYDYGGCAVIVWRRVDGVVMVHLQLDIGMVALLESAKDSFNVQYQAVVTGPSAGIVLLPRSAGNWTRYAVTVSGAVVPTVGAPLDYDTQWYLTTLGRPVLTIPSAELLIHANNLPQGFPVVHALEIDIGLMYYSSYLLTM
jgi:hypothetical protein